MWGEWQGTFSRSSCICDSVRCSSSDGFGGRLDMDAYWEYLWNSVSVFIEQGQLWLYHMKEVV
jgi:hypothetical protein